MGSVTEATTAGGERLSLLGVAGVVALVALSAYSAAFAAAPKLLFVGWAAFVAMAGGAALGTRSVASHPRGLVWGYGLASGAMVTSAAVFLIPPAVSLGGTPAVGGFGVAAGLLTGFAAHSVGHLVAHHRLAIDRVSAEITLHALAAGSIIGLIYATMPSMGALLGLAIVSHKGPAGYATVRRLADADLSPTVVLLPASGVGVAALTVRLVQPALGPTVQALVFGFAAGIFLHVAMDFLPHCEAGGEIHQLCATEHAHGLLDRLRVHAVFSTALGALAVLAGWLAV